MTAPSTGRLRKGARRSPIDPIDLLNATTRAFRDAGVPSGATSRDAFLAVANAIAGGKALTPSDVRLIACEGDPMLRDLRAILRGYTPTAKGRT